MSHHEPPKILRIKRKRGQDPLQALILEERHPAKKSKPSSPISSGIVTPIETPNEQKNVYFALTRTDDSTTIDDSVVQSVLSESIRNEDNVNNRKRKFIIPKHQTEEDAIIPNELSDMLSSFLYVNQSEEPKRKRRIRGGISSNELQTNEISFSSNNEINNIINNHESNNNDDDDDDQLSEYVYDVYQISSEPLTNANHPQSQIGYIRFFDSEDNDLYQSDDDDDPTRKIYSDEEDSNAESFYQNDYPSDEDADGLSENILNSDNEEIERNENDDDDDDDDIGPVIIQGPEEEEGYEYLRGDEYTNSENFDDLYDDFFDENDGTNNVNFLNEDQGMNDDYERQNFFPNEKDDELAKHRDRIFANLQRMIDEKP